MYRIDQNNVIVRNSDSKVIPRDINNVDYQTFIYIQTNRVDPATHNPVALVNLHGDR